MDRFNFLGRARGDAIADVTPARPANPTPTQTAPNPIAIPRPPPPSHQYSFPSDSESSEVDDDDDDYDDDRTPLSPRYPHDLEAQHPRAEMAERSTPTTRFIHRFRPPIPSFLSSRGGLRPTSSRYSGDGMPPDTVINHGRDNDESPKTPQFRIGVQDLPSTRLHLPNLTRTWTQGSNGPPSRPGTAARPSTSRGREEVERPAPAVVGRRRVRRSRGESGSGSREGSGEGSEQRGSRRRRRRREREAATQGEAEGSQRSERRPTPKHFMFCLPWIKSRRIRSQILRCFVSGMFLTLILTVYLSLSITKNINNSEFTVLLILIILFVTIFFCHGLIRLCMMLVRGGRNREDSASRSGRLPEMMGPGGYAIPREPIRVVLARDEEAAGIESEATKSNPPAYGLWRESVRVDPNRIYWQRNDETAPDTVDEEHPLDGSPGQSGASRHDHHEAGPSEGVRPTVPRPPSYASDDGVSYVVEAQPRSIAPTVEVPLRASVHPAEAGRAGRPPSW
ncbi:hypothetical protein B0T25DRAFT_460643 [Lasiosphaeria hispida]|uniref:Uncharacterized protein n=1 Tax=Lasiosphaeria hispida TaxID=260671 RepID=A0AAJ0HCS7_9PEZI|nr:hypothetical protein B0T25DRAFT_460643 [Lasiosphaeria hispida]